MDALSEELESLEAILMDDVRIVRGPNDVVESIETTVQPLTGEEDDQKYICVTLAVLPPAGYPDVSPNFKLLRPRGLDDARIEDIRNACNAKIKESLGFPVVFDLIEVVREHLTGSNLPSGQCVICLYGFCDGDEFTRTECFHYLHSYCLARHLNALRRTYQEDFDKLPGWLQKSAKPFQALCPVCREHINDETDSLKCAMPPSELENAPEFMVTQELREMQELMSQLYLQQKSRGAIIDVEAESGTIISIETEEDVRNREEAEAVKKLTAQEPASSTTLMKPVASSFAPVVQETQRAMPEPTNNNYQHHNRRHYRGGRRHQHHHHHHRGERAEAAQSSGAAVPAAAATATTGAGAGKQTKAQTAGAAHTR